MDIQRSEWPALENWLEEGDILPRIKQLAMEIHIGREPEVKDYQRYVRILKTLDHLGFKKWYQHRNAGCCKESRVTPVRELRIACFEFVYINVNFLKPTL